MFKYPLFRLDGDQAGLNRVFIERMNMIDDIIWT